MVTEPTPQQVLACPMDPATNDAGASSVGGYLIRLLAVMWQEGEGFSGKRPFGNSSWECEIYDALVRADLVGGVIDSDGYLDEVDDVAADRLVAGAIASLAVPAP